MISAVITAGGKGVRTGYKVPKQFLTVFDVPIIIYTLQNIAKIACIDKIVVVVPDGWQGFIQAYAEQYNIKKLVDVVLGGATRFESVFNGVNAIMKHLDSQNPRECLVGFYDGNRPLIPESVTLDAIAAAREHGAAVALEPCYDTMLECDGDTFVDQVLDRSHLYKGQCPEFHNLEVLQELQELAEKETLPDLPLYSLLLHLKKKLAYVKGSSKSFKITTADDIEIFKALIRVENH